MDDVDTIAAIATPPGAGGVGIVRVSGPGTALVMAGMIGRRLPARAACFARFLDRTGSVIDEGIGLYFAGPHSYTGEDVLELQGHGGPVVLNRLVERCLELGARPAQPGEFTKRAFLNGKLDLTQAEAVADLISARTEAAARSAARSLTGEFSKCVQGFQDRLTELRALLEASLDFPEEGIDFLEQKDVRGKLDLLAIAVDRALAAGRAGQLLRDGIAVALVGAPNVGKSSIINMLCGYDAAIVTAVPGTTRDLVKETIQIKGVPIQVVDTAGLRKAADVIEEIGIARAWRAVEATDLTVVVLDASGEVAALEPAFVARLPAAKRRIWVHNKIDLIGHAAGTAQIDGELHVWISAKTGQGRELLQDAILPSDASGPTESPFAARARQLDALGAARRGIQEAAEALQAPELAAEELRMAQLSLSEITGEVAADDILGEIFAKFCIGK